MVERIVIEIVTPGDSRTIFRALMDRLVVEENLTAAQAHLIVGKVLDRITLPRPAKKHSERSSRPVPEELRAFTALRRVRNETPWEGILAL
jgi:hypothetical protein